MAVETLKIVLTADNKQAIAGMNETVNSLNKVSTAGAATGQAVTKMGTNFTGLSRVIQDLPYGFNAISNNLTQLLPAAGAAGLAFSALISGLTFAQVGFGAWTRGMQAADEGMKAATKSVTEFTVNIQNSKNDIIAARQGIISKDEALKKYNSTLGDTIGYARSLDEAEKLMAANTNTVVQSLNLRARAQIMYQNAANESAKLVTGEAYNLGLLEQATVGVKTMFTGLAGIGKAAGQEMANKYKEATDNAKRLTAEGDKLIKQSLALESTLKKGAGPQGKTESKKKEVDLLKQESEEMLKQSLLLNTLKGKMAGEGVQAQEKRKLKDLTNLKLTTDGNQALNEVMLRQSEIQDQRNANLALANNLTDYAMQGLTNLVNVMANGGNIGAALGDMFKKLAVDIALAAAKAAIFQSILSVLNPATGAGKFFGSVGKLLGFAEGGTVSGPTTGYPVMLHGTEHIVRPDQMKSIIASASQMGGTSGGRVEVFGRIQGQDIWLSQQRTNTFRKLST